MLVLFEIRKANPFILNQLAQNKLVFFAPLAGLLMGIAQSFFETRPDNWAFVVHRPLSRRAVFAAKCLAGSSAALRVPRTTLPPGRCLGCPAWERGDAISLACPVADAGRHLERRLLSISRESL